MNDISMSFRMRCQFYYAFSKYRTKPYKRSIKTSSLSKLGKVGSDKQSTEKLRAFRKSHLRSFQGLFLLRDLLTGSILISEFETYCHISNYVCSQGSDACHRWTFPQYKLHQFFVVSAPIHLCLRLHLSDLSLSPDPLL